MRRQKGFTLISTLIVGVLIVLCLLLGFKLIPVFTEYFAIKKAFSAVVRDVPGDAPLGDFRKAYQRYAEIDDISSVRSEQLEIVRDSGSVTISVSYERTVPLLANASLLLAFDVSSGDAGPAKAAK